MKKKKILKDEENERVVESKSAEVVIETRGFTMMMKAKKDHVILQNDFRRDIKKGDDLSDIPERFYETLKTEKII